MSLHKYFNFNKINKEEHLQKLIKKIMKKKNVSEIVALREAEKIVFKPEHLERIKLSALKNVGLRPGITFYFDSADEVKLVAKFFSVNFSVMGVNDSTLLLEILRELKRLRKKCK